MDGAILVAYGTKYGATAEIAEKVGEVLRQAGLRAEVRSALGIGDLATYRSVVLGSAVYIGQWRKEAVELLQDNAALLASKPVWLFSSGPTGEGDPVALMKGWRFPEKLLPVAEQIGARDMAVFHGVLDPKKLSLPEKLIIKGIKAPMGDYRQWDAIAAWAAGIAESLKNPA